MNWLPGKIIVRKKKCSEINNPDYLGLDTNELHEIKDKITYRIQKIVNKSYFDFVGENNSRLIKLTLFVFQKKIKKIISNKLSAKLNALLQVTFKTFVISQNEIFGTYAQYIKTNGFLYERKTNLKVKISKGGEKAEAYTSEGQKTMNVAYQGDYIIQEGNDNNKICIIRKEHFEPLYSLINESKGLIVKNEKVYALEFNRNTFPKIYEQYKYNLSKNIVTFIEALWHENQKLERSVFFVLDEESRGIYIVRHGEFLLTYQKKNQIS